MDGSWAFSSGNKIYRLSTYRIARNGKVGGSSTSLKTWFQDRSTMVTAKFYSDGLMWDPIPAPLICCQMTLTAWKIWQERDACTMGKISWGWITLVFLGEPCIFPTYESWTGFPRWDISTDKTVSGCWWFHSRIKECTASRSLCCGTELKNPTKSSLTARRLVSSVVSSKNWWTRSHIWGTANCPIVWGHNWRSMESIVRAVTWRRRRYRLL